MDDIEKRKENFIKKAVSVHGEGKYDYSQVDYVNNKTKVKIRCIKHNIVFEIYANNHTIHKQECPKCADLRKRGLEEDLPDNFSDKQNQIITGSLLGDGSLTKLNKRDVSSRFSENHCNAQEKYLSWKKDILSPFSLPLITKKSRKLINLPGGKILFSSDEFYDDAFDMRTRSHPLFTKLEKSWYLRDKNNNYIFNGNGRRIKILPEDIEFQMTWLVIAVWFIDDGTNEPKYRKARFYSQSFTKEECQKLIDILFRKFGIECYLDKKRQIHVKTSSYLKFINSMTNSFKDNVLEIPECVQYKFDLSEYKEPNNKYQSKLNYENIQEIFEIRKSGLTHKEIAEKFNVDCSTISRILAGKVYKDITFKYFI